MIPPTPGPDPASRVFGYATPPDGAGPIGPDQLWPTPIAITRDEFFRGLNPLHHVPVVGMIYRAITGESIPTPLKIGGAVVASAIAGGPLGALGAVFLGLAEELVRLGPDQSRPALPEGFSVNGSEGGMSPVKPDVLI